MKTIKNKTYNNFMYIYNIVRKAKGYNHETAVEITEQLFDTLAANPGGNIYRWLDQVLTADEYKKIEYARKIEKLINSHLITLEEGIVLALNKGVELF